MVGSQKDIYADVSVIPVDLFSGWVLSFPSIVLGLAYAIEVRNSRHKIKIDAFIFFIFAPFHFIKHIY
jgi:hypothetical protein